MTSRLFADMKGFTPDDARILRPSAVRNSERGRTRLVSLDERKQGIGPREIASGANRHRLVDACERILHRRAHRCTIESWRNEVADEQFLEPARTGSEPRADWVRTGADWI